MKLSKSFRAFCSIIMAFMMINFAPYAKAEAAKEMISTINVVDQLSRSEAEATVRNFLDREDLQKELLEWGLSPEEAAERVASLSDADMSQLAVEINKAQYGGITGILVTVLLVVLIIYLVKRI